jgi:hypothetical protein
VGVLRHGTDGAYKHDQKKCARWTPDTHLVFHLHTPQIVSLKSGQHFMEVPSPERPEHWTEAHCVCDHTEWPADPHGDAVDFMTKAYIHEVHSRRPCGADFFRE